VPREPQVERPAIVNREFADQRLHRTPFELHAPVQLEHVHAFDDSISWLAVEQAASHRRIDAVVLQDGIVDVPNVGRVMVDGIDAR
jgi:hypothetical protein